MSRRFERWEWVAGAAAGALTLWIGSCALCSNSADLARSDPPRADPLARERSGSDAEIAALRMALGQEVEAREQLARELATLREQVESGATPSRGASSPAARTDRGAQRSMFDGNSLIAAGLAPAEAQELRSRWERTELEKIRLIDRATREGWLGTAKYQQELTSIDASLRGDLNEADYDRYLYATGRNNRARITDVLANSPGEAAGFKAGDTVLSYDGKRVFSIEELRELATSSRAGDTIRVEVLHDGEVETLYVPGGPIGLMLKPEHQAPR